MGQILKKFLLPLAICALFIFNSCISECLDNQNSIPLAGFYSKETNKSISIDSISVYGVGAPEDSMILRNKKGVTQVYLPMRINMGNVQYVFHYDQKAVSDPANNDTLTMKYDAIPFFESSECGAMYRYQIKEFSYTKNVLDSIVFTDSLITNTDKERIKIYFKTTTTE